MHAYPYQMQQQLYPRNYEMRNEGIFPSPLSKSHPSLLANPSLPPSTTKHQQDSSTPPRGSDNLHDKTVGFSCSKSDNMISCQYKETMATGKETESYQKQQLTSPSEVFISRNVSMNYSITEHKLNYPHKNLHNSNSTPFLHSS